jgi:fatty-acid peroxygenase
LFGPTVRGQSEAAEIRLLGRPATVVAGETGVRLFYDESAVQRQGATPRQLSHSLFGDGAVHSLDGLAHRQRKAMFMELLTPEAAASIASVAARRCRLLASEWRPGERVVLFDTAVQVFGAAVCEWAGIPAERVGSNLASDLATIVDGFGSVGPRYLRARLARRRVDRWAAALITDVRRGTVAVPARCALDVIATHRDLHETLLPPRVAGVELLNILRPTVAVAYFAAFTGLALHDHPQWRDRLEDEPTLEAFAQEVRRYYPFVPVLAARTRTALTWHDRRLPAGERLILDVYGTLHDERHWANASQFDPSRFRNGHPDPTVLIPQGGGPPTGHRCPGERVALDLIKTTARVLAALDYDLPPQDLAVSLRRMPTRPRSGVTITLRRPAHLELPLADTARPATD